MNNCCELGFKEEAISTHPMITTEIKRVTPQSLSEFESLTRGNIMSELCYVSNKQQTSVGHIRVQYLLRRELSVLHVLACSG